MIVKPLATNEIADNGGYTHIATVTANDLTQATANTAQTITICSLKAGDTILKVAWRAKTYFTDASDAAFNSTTMSIGDGTGVATHIAATQLNSQGTEVQQGFSNTAVAYLAANSLTITFNSMAAKSLSELDAGEVEVLFQLSRIAQLEEAVSGTAIT